MDRALEDLQRAHRRDPADRTHAARYAQALARQGAEVEAFGVLYRAGLAQAPEAEQVGRSLAAQQEGKTWTEGPWIKAAVEPKPAELRNALEQRLEAQPWSLEPLDEVSALGRPLLALQARFTTLRALPETSVWLALDAERSASFDLSQVAALPHVEDLVLSVPGTTDLRPLLDCPRLRSLRLWAHELPLEWVEVLAESPDLELELHLQGSGTGLDVAEALALLPCLRGLGLSGSRDGGSVLELVRDSPWLRTLRLHELGPAFDLEPLGELSGLTRLTIETPESARLAESLARVLPRCRSLESLTVFFSAFLNERREAAIQRQLLRGSRAVASLRRLGILHPLQPGVVASELAGWSSLEELSLAIRRPTLADFESLQECPGLRSLAVQGLVRTPALGEALGRLRALQHLYLHDAGAFDVRRLEPLERLVSLRFSATQLDPDGWPGLAAWPRLRALGLSRSGIGDAALEHLCQSPGRELLRSLDLSRTEISDRGAPALERLTGLHHLDLEHTKLRPATVRRLQAQLRRTRAARAYSTEGK